MREPLPLPMTLEEYLAFEERSTERHEYVGGYVYLMTGANVTHHRIVTNVHVALHLVARGGPCVAYRESFRLRIGDDFYYPDVMVACGESLAPKAIATERPCLLVEVRSERTWRTDQTEKRAAYEGVPTLRGYVRIHNEYRYVEWDRREPDGRWTTERFENVGALALECPRAVLTLDAIYEGLDVPPFPLRRLKERADAYAGAGEGGAGRPG